jgi:hypothetical protein
MSMVCPPSASMAFFYDPTNNKKLPTPGRRLKIEYNTAQLLNAELIAGDKRKDCKLEEWRCLTMYGDLDMEVILALQPSGRKRI